MCPRETNRIFLRYDLLAYPTSLTCLLEELQVTMGKMRTVMCVEHKKSGFVLVARNVAQSTFSGGKKCVVLKGQPIHRYFYSVTQKKYRRIKFLLGSD